MGTSLSTWVHPACTDWVDGVIAIVLALIKPGREVHAKFRTTANFNPITPPFTFNVEDRDFSDHLRHFFESNSWMFLDFGYRLADGRDIPLSIDLLGKKSNRFVGERGNFMFALNQSALWPDVAVDGPDQLSEEEAWQTFVRNNEQLFFDLCGLAPDGVNVPVDHGHMFVELSRGTPGDGFAVYHARPTGFVSDFRRLLASYRWGVAQPFMLGAAVDIAGLRSRPEFRLAGPLCETSFTLADKYPEERLAKELAESVDEPGLARIASVRETKLRDEVVESVIAAGQINVYEFENGGIGLYTTPNHSLWPFYAELWKRLRW